MRVILSILLCLMAFVVDAQDLTGIWRGHFKSSNYSKLLDSLGIDDKYKFETQIEQNAKSFSGVTYSYRSTVFYGKAACYGAINQKTKKVLLEENKLLEVQSAGGGACLMTLFLQYSKVGNEEFLEGTFTAMDVKDSTACPGGTVFLRKVPNSDFYKEPFLAEKEKEKEKEKKTPPAENKPAETPKTDIATAPKKPAPTVTKPPAVKTPARKPPAQKPLASTKPSTKPKASAPDVALKNDETIKQLPAKDTLKTISPKASVGIPVPRVIETRVNELVRTITTSAKDIYIKIYDNGTIDNDTVSVYVDNKLVVSKQRLTESPITVKLNLDDKVTFHELVMVAENLGEIPPNTSLMVVNAGDQQYEVRITSTEQKNAVVHFRRE